MKQSENDIVAASRVGDIFKKTMCDREYLNIICLTPLLHTNENKTVKHLYLTDIEVISYFVLIRSNYECVVLILLQIKKLRLR